jgi:hypothetical protein
MNNLKCFNLAESNLDGSLYNSNPSSAQPRVANESCTTCAGGTWADLGGQRWD